MSARQTSKYWVRSSRTSSASRLSERVVKPTRSANSTETIRRSVAGGAAAEARSRGRLAPPSSPIPHSSQYLASGLAGVEQPGHTRAYGAPHSEQNLLSGRLWAPQLGQATANTCECVGASSIADRRRNAGPELPCHPVAAGGQETPHDG